MKRAESVRTLAFPDDFEIPELKMLKDLFDFSKKRTGKEAALFYVFYMGCFALVTLAFEF